ncbi:MAG TPA: tRNA (adenosine(37)-N6)-threonylcarbamoyltransferase complex dimerization subunit type 1 TsaB [Bacteroidales bacterium]|nr:tRNA (adenosine(37)-N6)-threonylcarbamoyltransferase complex dimerization subunit type 1 TsaB [Bacteroidales bacterium]
MPYILYLETATHVCSVAIAKNDRLIAIKETSIENSHSSLITVFVEEVIQEAKIQFTDLNAVCVSMGPGSYTGLRIGVSSAKGFCYALNIPLIAVNTLQSMANSYIQKNLAEITEATLLCPMIDARRMEVYSAIFNKDLDFIRITKADIVEENSYQEYLNNNSLIFFGNGAEKCESLLSKNPHTIFDKDFVPSAKGMISLALEKYKKQEFENLAYFEPYYLKDFIATTPKK